jgi:hypothetical protein
MPISMNLRENGHVFHLVFTNPWNSEELLNHYEQEARLLDSSPFRIHSMVDVRESRAMASGALQIARHRGRIEHPRRGIVVILGASNFRRNLMEMVFRMARFNRVRYFVSESDAWVYLRQVIQNEGSAETI